MKSRSRTHTLQVTQFLFIAAAVASQTSPVNAHEDGDWDHIRLSLLSWAAGVMSHDVEGIASALHEDMTVNGMISKEAYLAEYEDVPFLAHRIDIRHAEYELGQNRVRVTRVIAYGPEGEEGVPLAIELVKANGNWLIREIISEGEQVEGPREEPSEKSLPEHFQLRPVHIRVRDAETGKPVVSRVHAEDENGEYWPPQGHMKTIQIGFREDVGGDVRVGKKNYAYVEPDFILPVPNGSYELEVVRGIEYEPQTVELKLKRWSNLQAEGWYSGDTHIHFLSPAAGLLETKGEYLNVANILATKWGEQITNVEEFTGAPSPVSEPNNIVYVNEECRHGFLGHTIFLQLKELVYPLTWGGPGEGSPGGYDYPPMATLIDEVHEQGGFVSWAHFPWPNGEVAVDVALGKLDSVDVMTWGDAFEEDLAGSALTWYRFLNCGFKIPATAGTDKMHNSQVVGSVRTYVKVDGPFNYGTWIDGIRAGRTFITSGPLLKFTAEEAEIGDTINAEPGATIRVRAEVSSAYPVDRIEIVQGGIIVAEKENTSRDREFSFQTQVTVNDSTWVAARCYSSEGGPPNQAPSQAHTSPIYINVPGSQRQSPEDAAFLAEWCDRGIEWIKNEGNFLDESHRDEMIALFNQAKRKYQEQM